MDALIDELEAVAWAVSDALDALAQTPGAENAPELHQVVREGLKRIGRSGMPAPSDVSDTAMRLRAVQAFAREARGHVGNTRVSGLPCRPDLQKIEQGIEAQGWKLPQRQRREVTMAPTTPVGKIAAGLIARQRG